MNVLQFCINVMCLAAAQCNFTASPPTWINPTFKEWHQQYEVLLDCSHPFHPGSCLPQTFAAAEQRVIHIFGSGLIWVPGLNTFKRNFYYYYFLTLWKMCSLSCVKNVQPMHEGERWRTDLYCNSVSVWWPTFGYCLFHLPHRLRASFIRACRRRHLNNLSSWYNISELTSKGLRLFLDQWVFKRSSLGDGVVKTAKADRVMSIFWQRNKFKKIPF